MHLHELRETEPAAIGPRKMVVAGVMSGTSADGVDVAICRVTPAKVQSGYPQVKVLAHHAVAYPAEVRAAVLTAMEGQPCTPAEMARLSWRLGEVYAEAVREALARWDGRPDLVALHGQTIYHQPGATEFLGAPVRCTWQTGEPAVVAERLGVPVVSDFRTADLAAGGQGAPLVPMFDLCQYRHASRNRVLLNLGGIANLTALPAGCFAEDVLAFDSGPANMVIDGCMQRLYGRAYDCGGATGARGVAREPVLRELMGDPYLSLAPPKSCGREQFGAAFTENLLKQCGGARRSDAVATATAFTAETVVAAYRDFVRPHLERRAPLAQATEVLVSGGGARNKTLVRRLRTALEPFGCVVNTTEEVETVSISPEAKEAAAFALLGWLTWHGMPGSLPSGTGARESSILGRITQVRRK